MPFTRSPIKRLVALFASLLCVCLCASCKQQVDTYELSQQLIGLLWNVDYETFSPEQTEKFARHYFEQGYLENFLADPEGETGAAENRANQLKSRLNSVSDQGSEQQILEDTEYTVQRVQISVTLDSFAPERPEDSFFEQGQTYLLNYQVYFVNQNGALKIAGFSFAPEGEAYLPAKEKQPLTEEEKADVTAIAEEYLRARYEVDYTTFLGADVFDFYTAHLSEAFLARDGITLASLGALEEEFKSYHVSIRLLSNTLSAAAQKTSFFDGENHGYYYYVQAEYAYEITADPSYFAQKDLASSKIVKELLYFERQPNGEFLMIGAEYV